MLALDSVFHYSTVFGQIRSLVMVPTTTESQHSAFKRRKSDAMRTQAPTTSSAQVQDAIVCVEAIARQKTSEPVESLPVPLGDATNLADAEMSSGDDEALRVSSQPLDMVPETVATDITTPSILTPSSEPSSTQATLDSTSSRSMPSSQQSQRATKRKRFYYTIAERSSLYDVMHENAGVSLFIRPIAWTDKHSSALNVNWVDGPKITSPSPDPSATRDPRRKLEPAAYVLCKELSAIFSSDVPMPFYSVSSIREVLSQLYPQTSFATSRGEACPEMRIWFGSRVHRDAIRVQCMWRWPYPTYPVESQSDESNLGLESFQTESTQPAKTQGVPPAGAVDIPAHCGKPMLAYIGRKQLSNIRAHIYRVALGPGKTPNEPVARLQALRSKLLIPTNADYDPHLVAVLLAMAQDHIYPSTIAPYLARGGAAPLVDFTPEFRDVTVRVLSTDNDNAEFVIYKATFTADYLRQFHYPHKAFPQRAADGQSVSRTGLDIEVTKVPIWPIIGLRERLGQALSEEMVGHFDIDNPETWDCTSSESEPEAGPPFEAKRRRRPQAFFNGSFEEEFSEPRRNGKRRRLGDEGSNQVEVVM
ncbi:hypothetical protein jhhlp_008101 [Lomentospora prolificans]|uniref:Uncharacterized protein n=1 Tax=Lomentospora prolificans TaxID=41688 RepID=A0A2N3MZH6_9PEZI|nr:hypothetical protein jhhlp_008101 [Lomentospora prolificans]